MSEYRCKHCDKVVIQHDEPFPDLIYGDKCLRCGGKWELLAYPSPAVYNWDCCGYRTTDPKNIRCPQETSEECYWTDNFSLVTNDKFINCPKCDGENYPGNKECMWCQNPLNFGDRTGYVLDKKVFMTRREAFWWFLIIGLILIGKWLISSRDFLQF